MATKSKYKNGGRHRIWESQQSKERKKKLDVIQRRHLTSSPLLKIDLYNPHNLPRMDFFPNTRSDDNGGTSF